MSKKQDAGDWSNDSASLFREARHAHDPTPAESARLDAVLARVQASKVDGSLAANRGASVAAPRAASAMLRLIASVSLGVVCIVAASVAFIRVDRHPAEPAPSVQAAPAAVASPPQPVAIQPAPALVPTDELSTSALAPAARDEARSYSRSQRRRTRGASERQQSSRIVPASAPEASSSGSHENSTGETALENSDTRQQRTEPAIPAKAVAAIQQSTPRASSSASNPKPVAATAREAEPMPTEAAPTELAMMKRMHSALHDSDFSTVLALCAEHARRWPHGVFELEREGVRAIASCGGDSDDAALRAQRFLSAHPHAPVAMRVSAACAVQLRKR